MKKKQASGFQKHPGIWFTLWSFETLFFLNLISFMVDLTKQAWDLYQLFLRVWLYWCFWWITVFHVRWIEKMDKQQYEKQKQKDELKNKEAKETP
jgi:hypothetical protein